MKRFWSSLFLVCLAAVVLGLVALAFIQMPVTQHRVEQDVALAAR